MAKGGRLQSEERARLIARIDLWIGRSTDQRTGNHVLVFYGWLQQHHPELVPREGQGDPYQHLQAELARYIIE